MSFSASLLVRASAEGSLDKGGADMANWFQVGIGCVFVDVGVVAFVCD